MYSNFGSNQDFKNATLDGIPIVRVQSGLNPDLGFGPPGPRLCSIGVLPSTCANAPDACSEGTRAQRALRCGVDEVPGGAGNALLPQIRGGCRSFGYRRDRTVEADGLARVSNLVGAVAREKTIRRSGDQGGGASADKCKVSEKIAIQIHPNRDPYMYYVR